ncbi:MAG: hypothetical protein ACYSX0_13705 [Planctomycetota bacterium]
MHQKQPEWPSAEDLKEAGALLQKRYAPLAEAKREWSAWSALKDATEALRRCASPEQAACALKQLVVAVDLVEKGQALDSLLRDLLPATRKAIQMLLGGVSVEKVGAHLRAWRETHFGHEVGEEIVYRLGTLVEDRLRAEEHLSRACSKTMRAVDRTSGSVTGRAEGPRLSASEYKVFRLLESRATEFCTERQIEDAFAGDTKARTIVSRLRKKRIAIESARAARRAGKSVPLNAKGYRLEV